MKLEGLPLISSHFKCCVTASLVILAAGTLAQVTELDKSLVSALAAVIISSRVVPPIVTSVALLNEAPLLKVALPATVRVPPRDVA